MTAETATQQDTNKHKLSDQRIILIQPFHLHILLLQITLDYLHKVSIKYCIIKKVIIRYSIMGRFPSGAPGTTKSICVRFIHIGGSG